MHARTIGFAAILAMSIVGCANSSSTSDAKPSAIDGSHQTGDAPKSVDAKPVDAPAAANPLGTACTGTGQGTCPTGFDCLNLNGASGSWCSKKCTPATAGVDPCDQGFAGPGVGACNLTVTPAGGGAGEMYCSIICSDEPGAPTLCAPATRCTGTCPTPLMCTGQLNSTGGGLVGKVCQ